MQLDSNIVDTAVAYFQKLGIPEKEIDWDETGKKKYSVSMKEYNAIQTIITLQIGFYCLRRLGSCCGSNVDMMWSLINKAIKVYEKKYNKEYQNFNGDYIH